MVVKRTTCSFYIILLTGIIFSTRSHPDCNHKKVVERLYYMCNAYGAGASSIKREINGGGFLPPPSGYGPHPSTFGENTREPTQPQQFPQYPYLQYPNGGFPTSQQPMNPIAPNPPLLDNSIYPGQAPYNSQNPPAEDTTSESWTTPTEQTPPAPFHKERLHPSTDVNGDPEDFASFNDYFLNPVYADADWQSSIERWRRNPHIQDAIYSFVRNQCCVTGCPFPDDYWELDKRVNICGMR